MRQQFGNLYQNIVSDTDDVDFDLDNYIPLDPQQFYEDFGYLVHPKTGQDVLQLTPYQYEIWEARYEHKYRAVFKSQKVGLSTSVLLEDFQASLTDCRGFDILVVAQTQAQANEHLRTLKGLILSSEKYRKYLITKPSDLILKEEKTKVGVAYIKNPDNRYRPSRIIALGFSESAMWSHKNVKRIHVSDPTVAKTLDDSQIFGAMFSRLANTNGDMIIETPPRRPKGVCWEIYDKYYKNPADSLKQKWKIFIVKAEQAVNAGLIAQEFLDDEKIRLGPLYPMFYEAEFLSVGGNVFPPEAIDKALELGERFKDNPVSPYKLHLGGVDFGFSSSLTTIYVGEIDEENNVIRIMIGEEYDKALPSFIARRIFEIHKQIPNLWWFVDGANRGAVNEVKGLFRESLDWERSEDVSPQSNKIIPVAFVKDHKNMLQHTYHQITKERLAIPKNFNKLEIALRTAWAVGFDLDKDQTMHDDHLDALRLLLKGVKEKEKELK